MVSEHSAPGSFETRRVWFVTHGGFLGIRFEVKEMPRVRAALNAVRSELATALDAHRWARLPFRSVLTPSLACVLRGRAPQIWLCAGWTTTASTSRDRERTNSLTRSSNRRSRIDSFHLIHFHVSSSHAVSSSGAKFPPVPAWSFHHAGGPSSSSKSHPALTQCLSRGKTLSLSLFSCFAALLNARFQH